MKIRINGSWVDTSLYIRDGGVWKYIGNPSSANEIVVYITSTTTNVNVSSFFGPYWTQNIAKKLIINSGVTVGATSTNNYALNVSSGLIGILRVDNYGSIQGAGGLPNGGTGGNAILANSSVSINNQGTIYAGGVGGNGGVGQGYNQSPTSGSPGFGGSAGGINAGTGGFGAFGGAGGGWGASGGAGSTGGTGANGNYTVGSVGSAGSPGGLPGFYVVNNGNISWINTGSVLGRVV